MAQRLSPSAIHALKRLPHKGAAAIAEFITKTLPTDPYTMSNPLRYELEGWRVARRGGYRVTFQALLDQHTLYVGWIEHRAHAYRRLCFVTVTKQRRERGPIVHETGRNYLWQTHVHTLKPHGHHELTVAWSVRKRSHTVLAVDAVGKNLGTKTVPIGRNAVLRWKHG